VSRVPPTAPRECSRIGNRADAGGVLIPVPPERVGLGGQNDMHPSMPQFAQACADRERLAAIDLEPALAPIRTGVTDRKPTELLEVQLETAAEQLRVARERLMRSRRRVAELQEAVGQVEAFLAAARRRCAVPA
jgi:hypothetical protein